MPNENRSRVFVVGVGMTPFLKANQPKPTYVDVGRAAILDALADAGLSVGQVDAVVASYNNGEPASGHRVVQAAGVSHVPIINVNGNCSAGSVALNLARQMVRDQLDRRKRKRHFFKERCPAGFGRRTSLCPRGWL